MTKLSSLKGKRIVGVSTTASGRYVNLDLATETGRSAGKLLVDIAYLLDKNGDHFEDDAPAQ